MAETSQLPALRCGVFGVVLTTGENMDVRAEATISPAQCVASLTRQHGAVLVDETQGARVVVPRPRLPQDAEPAPAPLPAPRVPPPYVMMQRTLARHSAAIRSMLTTSSSRQAGGDGPPGVARAVRPRARAGTAWPATVLEFACRDQAQLIAELNRVAGLACRLGGHSLDGLIRARQADPGVAGRPQAESGPAGRGAPADTARAAIIGSDPRELAALARTASAILRTSAGKPLPSQPQVPGIRLSEGARGRVALLFGGLAVTPLQHSAALAGSAATLCAVDRLGIEPCVAAAYGLGEILGLAWAGAITLGEAARLAALRAELLRVADGNAAMARVRGDRQSTARLLEGSGLVVAVDEGPRQQVVTGPTASVRMLPYRAADLGVTAEVLPVPCGLHSPVMRPCVAPMAAVVAGTRVGTPQRRLISSVTGLDFALSGDPAGLLARQLDRPAQLAAALALAGAGADLVLLATPDPALAEAAAACCKVPVIQPPLDLDGRRGLELLAALYTAGAIDSVRRFLPGAPAIRAAEPQPTAPPLVTRLTA
jgi:enediyne polyketide synthase